MTAPGNAQKDAQLSARAKRVFDDSVDALDAATLSRLNRGRQAALAEISSTAARPRWTIWAPAGGIAAAVFVAVLMTRAPGGSELIEAPADDFEILLSEESIDMLEDLEFYSWLEDVDIGMVEEVG